MNEFYHARSHEADCGCVLCTKEKKSRKKLPPVVFSKVTKVVLPFYVSLKYINVM